LTTFAKMSALYWCNTALSGTSTGPQHDALPRLRRAAPRNPGLLRESFSICQTLA